MFDSKGPEPSGCIHQCLLARSYQMRHFVFVRWVPPLMVLREVGPSERQQLWQHCVSAAWCSLHSLCSPCPWLTRNSRTRSPSSSMPWEATPPWPQWTSVGMAWGTWGQRCWPKRCRSTPSSGTQAGPSAPRSGCWFKGRSGRGSDPATTGGPAVFVWGLSFPGDQLGSRSGSFKSFFKIWRRVFPNLDTVIPSNCCLKDFHYEVNPAENHCSFPFHSSIGSWLMCPERQGAAEGFGGRAGKTGGMTWGASLYLVVSPASYLPFPLLRHKDLKPRGSMKSTVSKASLYWMLTLLFGGFHP